MILVSSKIKRFLLSVTGLTLLSAVSAQVNSPFSRYGIGDLYPNQNIASRGLGGLTAAFSDPQAINSDNPASYSNIYLTTYDIGISIDSRILQDNAQGLKYNSINFSPSYITLGFPVDKRRKIGMAFGLKPLSQINYSIEQYSKLPGIDSIQNLYQGSGGLNQAFIGLGKKWKGLSLGFNTGFNFGKKDISSKVNILNDTVKYNGSNSEANTALWGVFLNAGLQYDLKLKERSNDLSKTREIYHLRFGGDVSVQQKLHANQNLVKETFNYDVNGAVNPLDVIQQDSSYTGTVSLPASYTAGLMFVKTIGSSIGELDNWMIGVEYDAARWSQYRFYDQPDRVRDNWMLRAGFQITPDPFFAKDFWSRTTYKFGFFTGKDYVDADGNGLKVEGITAGAAFHLRKFRSYGDNQFTLLNTSLEVGKRGSGVNNITEGFVKFSVGLSLSDVWFIKRKYD